MGTLDQNGKPLRVMYLCMCNMTVGGAEQGQVSLQVGREGLGPGSQEV